MITISCRFAYIKPLPHSGQIQQIDIFFLSPPSLGPEKRFW